MRPSQMDDIVEACHPTDGILKGCVPDREAQDFIIDLMGSLFKDIVANDDEQKLAFAGALSSKLDASGHLSLAAAGLQTFADAFSVGDLDFDRRQGARQRLGELAGDDDYDGFLKGGYSEKRWTEVAHWSKQQYEVEAKKVDMATANELQKAFEVFNKEKVSFADRATFERIVVKSLVVAAEPEASKPLVAAVGNILAGLAEITKGGLAKFHVFLQEVCMAGVELRSLGVEKKLEVQNSGEFERALRRVGPEVHLRHRGGLAGCC